MQIAHLHEGQLRKEESSQKAVLAFMFTSWSCLKHDFHRNSGGTNFRRAPHPSACQLLFSSYHWWKWRIVHLCAFFFLMMVRGSIWWFSFLNFILTVPKPRGGFSHLATPFWINCLFSPRLTPSCFQTQRWAARWLCWYPLCSGRSWGPVCFMTFQSDEKVLLATLWGIFLLPTVWVFHLNPIFLVRH